MKFKTRTLLYGAGLLLVPLIAFAETSPIRVDGNTIKGYIARMSGNEQLGRKTLTPDYEKVAAWAAGMFKQWGLKPAGENGTYLQGVPIRGTRSDFAYTLGVPEMSINGRTFYVRDSSFVIDPSSTPTPKVPISGTIVFVGYGISAPSKGLDEYSVDVKGKVVLALKGSPKDAPAARGMGMMGPAPAPAPAQPAEDVWKDESTDTAKAKMAYEKGAAAILLYNPAAVAPAASMPQRPALETSPFKRPFLFVSSIDEQVFRWILWTDRQQSSREFTARIDQMRRDIKDKKVRSTATIAKAVIKGYDSVTLFGEKFNSNVSHNVLAKIEGSDPALKGQYVIVGGHLDHLGVTNGVVYNGADDNASGSAVTMEVARLLATNKVPLKRTVVFGLWCGEEEGLHGSNYYVSAPTDGVTIDKVAGYINMDMVGLGDNIGAPGALNFPEIYNNVIMRDQLPEIAKLLRPSQAGPGGSDYSAFIERGVEALALMTGGGAGHPDYHDSGDDTDKIDADILGKTGQFVLQAVINLGNETQMNLLIADRQAQYDGMRINIPVLAGVAGEGGRGGGRGAGGGWQLVKASSSADLLALANDRIKELKGPRPALPAGVFVMAGRGAAGGQVTLGVRDAGLFDGNVQMMQELATALDFGRLDVVKNDGAWFNFNGGVSEKGKEAIKAMEAGNVVLNLVNPSSKLLADVLDSAAKPFMVTLTGSTPVETAQIARMSEKNALLAVECGPADVQGCVNRLEGARKQFGKKDNLLLLFSTGEKMDEAKKSLYMSLVNNGWTKDEIYAMVGVSPTGSAPGGRGNLSKVLPAPPVPPRPMP